MKLLKQNNLEPYFVVSVNSFASLPRTTRGMPIVLGGDPKGKNVLYVNGNSVIIRDIAVSGRTTHVCS